MAGIYIHIPFCKQACHYCNFHFSTNLEIKSRLIDAILKEIVLRNEHYNGEIIQTIYFGGGTPSVLTQKELNAIINSINKHFKISEQIELTLEANPDDINKAYLTDLKKSGINRFSLGVQSFHDTDLLWMNRAHNALESEQSIRQIQDAGFENFSIDLIFGSPTTTTKMWEQNLSKAIDLQIKHLSCYGLTVEPNTALIKQIKKGNSKNIDQDIQAEQFLLTLEKLESKGYDHYEISNYALPGFLAIHNTNYWKAYNYLGLGPSAHSYDGSARYWNINNNLKYITAIENNSLDYSKEILSPTEKYNEYILTGLRTKWGCNLEALSHLGPDFEVHFQKDCQRFLTEGTMVRDNDFFRLSPKGKLFADQIASDLFKV